MDASVISTVGFVLGIMGFVAAGLVYFRGAWDKATIASLKESRDALLVLDKQKGEQITALEDRVGHLETENQLLTALTTKAPDVERLTESLEEYTTEVSAQTKMLQTGLAQVLEAINGGR